LSPTLNPLQQTVLSLVFLRLRLLSELAPGDEIMSQSILTHLVPIGAGRPGAGKSDALYVDDLWDVLDSHRLDDVR